MLSIRCPVMIVTKSVNHFWKNRFGAKKCTIYKSILCAFAQFLPPWWPQLPRIIHFGVKHASFHFTAWYCPYLWYCIILYVSALSYSIAALTCRLYLARHLSLYYVILMTINSDCMLTCHNISCFAPGCTLKAPTDLVFNLMHLNI